MVRGVIFLAIPAATSFFTLAADLSELDYLVESASTFPVGGYFSGPAPCGKELLGGAPDTPCYTLSNGLVTRTWAALEDGGFGTIALVGEPSLFRGAMPHHALRALADEAQVSLDLAPQRIGALEPVSSAASGDGGQRSNDADDGTNGRHGLYLNRSSLAVQTVAGSWLLHSVDVSSSAVKWPPGMSWTPRRFANQTWPPEGQHVAFALSPPPASKFFPEVRVTVHYECYRGHPIMTKWIEVSALEDPLSTDADANEEIVVTSATVELLALNSEFAPGGDSFGGASWDPKERASLLDVTPDSAHSGQITVLRSPDWDDGTDAGASEPLLVANYSKGPGARLSSSPNKTKSSTFRSFRVHEVFHEVVDYQRMALARLRLPRLLAPWTTESPLFLHLTDASAESIRSAADQCAAVGFDMIILSFGTDFEMEVAAVPGDIKDAIAYATSIGIEVGGYDLIDLQRGFGGYGAYVGDEYVATALEWVRGGHSEVTSSGCNLDHDHSSHDHGHDHSSSKSHAHSALTSTNKKTIPEVLRGGDDGPCGEEVKQVKLEDACFASGFVDDLRGYLAMWADEGGLRAFELDGPYGGGGCASTNHSHHHEGGDSVFLQERQSEELMTWLVTNKSSFVNQPDNYFYYGGSKTGMGYNEDQYSLPRWEDLTVSRAGMYDDTFRYLTTQGWMQVPLVDYHGGGNEAAFEQLSDHPVAFEMALAQYIGFGVGACWRGPRLYDSEDTQGLVTKWTSFYREYRQLLTNDIVHLRRADGQGLDAILHVNPLATSSSTSSSSSSSIPSLKSPSSSSAPTKAMLLVFNPTDSSIATPLSVPLYYSGITDAASVEEGPGPGLANAISTASTTVLSLNRRYEVTIEVNIEPRSAKWFIISDVSEV